MADVTVPGRDSISISVGLAYSDRYIVDGATKVEARLSDATRILTVRKTVFSGVNSDPLVDVGFAGEIFRDDINRSVRVGYEFLANAAAQTVLLEVT